MRQISDKKFKSLFERHIPYNYGIVTYEEKIVDTWTRSTILAPVYELYCHDENEKTSLKFFYYYPLTENQKTTLKRLFALHNMETNWIDFINEEIEFEIEHNGTIPHDAGRFEEVL